MNILYPIGGLYLYIFHILLQYLQLGRFVYMYMYLSVLPTKLSKSETNLFTCTNCILASCYLICLMLLRSITKNQIWDTKMPCVMFHVRDRTALLSFPIDLPGTALLGLKIPPSVGCFFVRSSEVTREAGRLICDGCDPC